MPAIDTVRSADRTAPGETGLFRDAMASFPSGVTIVTTTDVDDRWWGFTATSFCSVSLEPPLVLVCLARTAQCHPVFADASRWVVHVIRSDDANLATRFATRGADKFRDVGFTADPGGPPVLDRACVRLDCTTHATYTAGDHTILLGRVRHVRVGDPAPAVYFRRAFHTLRTAAT
ncbi:MAG TPA: flavin reductase family protein [Pseudonocardiaceae bacterium]|nr:flavin reductase family protein [Pseudonocardiaceae bacterium]